MTPVELFAVRLAERFPGIDAALIARQPAFKQAVVTALHVAPLDVLLAEVAKLGGLVGARNPYAVLVARIRNLPAALADRARLGDEITESRRWAAVDQAVVRGETLRGLVDRAELFPDEARNILGRELADAELRAIAEAALGVSP